MNCEFMRSIRIWASIHNSQLTIHNSQFPHNFQFTISGRPSDPVFHHLARDGVAVQAEQVCGVADAAFGPLKRSRDEHFLELAARVVVQDPFVEHLLDELVELIAHGYSSSRPESSR